MKILWQGLAILTAGALTTARAQQAAGPVELRELERFVDSVFARGIAAERIPGAAFCFVKDAEVFLCKGYGVGDLRQRHPVSAASTVFRIGSISKVFTATAVVQLADRGLIDMNADVNGYLRKIRVASEFPAPVRVKHLLDHTAGFDEIRPGTQTDSRENVMSLADFLRTRLVRIWPPGEITSYSTYGITLAGLLVEEVSGLSIEEYLKRNIWSPLRMSRTSISVPSAQQSLVATGYDLVGDSLKAQAWEWYHTTPASSVNSTAEDMTKFMIALLDSGRNRDARILSTRASGYMQRQHATAHLLLPGFALGLYEDYVGQLRLLEHGGNMAGFSALMVLMPKERDGFIVLHHRENSRFRDEVKDALLKRYYAAARERFPVPVASASFKKRVALFTGRYAPTTSCHSCRPRSVPYIIDIKATGDSSALIITGRNWIEKEPFLFMRDDGTGYIAFRRDSAGVVKYMFAGGFWSFERLP